WYPSGIGPMNVSYTRRWTKNLLHFLSLHNVTLEYPELFVSCFSVIVFLTFTGPFFLGILFTTPFLLIVYVPLYPSISLNISTLSEYRNLASTVSTFVHR